MFEVGKTCQKFSIPTDDGVFELKDNSELNTIIFFFPRANTSGCIKQASEFSKLIEIFNTLKTQIIGISKDNPETQKKFRNKHNLKCILGSDHKSKICEMFGVWVEKSMYGKKYMGIERTTFLIDKELKVLKKWSKVKVPNHVNEVLSFLKNI